MAFDVADLDVTQLFKNDDVFNIPRYQRGYVWKEKNWEQLLKDIRYCAEITPDWSHFIGSMVFERKQKSGGKVGIIDGQQRIITIQVLIFAMIFTFEKQRRSIVDDGETTNKCNHNIEYLKDLIQNKTLDADATSKVDTPYSSFTQLNQSAIDVKEDEEFNKFNEIVLGKSSDPILSAFRYFCSDFQMLNFEELCTFNRQLTRTRVVTISSMQEEEVYNIFEILNARGVKLKQVELLKNYLFKYLKPKSLLDPYKNKWGDFEDSLDGIDLDDYYLHLFRCLYDKRKTNKYELFEATRDELRTKTDEERKRFFDYFIGTASIYKDISNGVGNETEKRVYSYFIIKNIRFIRPVLIALKVKYTDSVINEDLYNKLLLWIRNFFIVFNLDGGTSNKIEDSIYYLSYRLYWDTDSTDVEYHVLEFLEKNHTYFKNSILENGIKNIVYSNKSNRKNTSSRLLVYLFKPFLLECETNKFVEYDFSKFNIEHVLNDDEDDDTTYSIGNLLLSPESVNSKMKNKEYSEKRQILLDSGIPYLAGFANEHPSFTKEMIDVRTKVVVDKLICLYGISKKVVTERLNELICYRETKKLLINEFGSDNMYLQEFSQRTSSFSGFVVHNPNIPEEDRVKLKVILNIE